MALATSREKLSEAIALAKARGESPDLSRVLMAAGVALDRGEWDEAIDRLDKALTYLTPPRTGWKNWPLRGDWGRVMQRYRRPGWRHEPVRHTRGG